MQQLPDYKVLMEFPIGYEIGLSEGLLELMGFEWSRFRAGRHISL